MNRDLAQMYWRIGREILARLTQQGWGTRVIDRLAQDLLTAFPDMKGFWPRNLKYLRAFADTREGGICAASSCTIALRTTALVRGIWKRQAQQGEDVKVIDRMDGDHLGGSFDRLGHEQQFGSTSEPNDQSKGHGHTLGLP